ncbi:MAG TPA: alginate lyase family protein [Gemmatimonadaceae bacterium]|nr:alginate lyase family protein [Gemmatimonadaceae bacterium]
MKRFVTRLRRASADELLFRAREYANTRFEQVRVGARANRWRRERLASRLDPRVDGLAPIIRALRHGDVATANAALHAHFLLRRPRFLLEPARKSSIVEAVRTRFPAASVDAVERAAPLIDGRYGLLGYRDLSFRRGTSAVDWHFDPVHERRAPLRFWKRVPYLDRRIGDHKIIWELNRHQHWLALGRAAWLTGDLDRRYSQTVARELESWLRANPPLRGINWASMLELALRSLSWIWTLHFFASDDGRNPDVPAIDLLYGIERQLAHVAKHLSFYFSPNTHLLGEALALYVAGRALPELRAAADWEHVGRRVLMREARAQVHADGGHAELSTHYHRYAFDFYLLALAIARNTADPVAPEFAEVCWRMATYCRAMADDTGRLPTIGDDDGGMLFPICARQPADVRDSLSLAAVLLDRPELAIGDVPEEVFWMLGTDATTLRTTTHVSLPWRSSIFRETGYAVLRSADDHAVFDVGRHGFLNGGHAHADALSIVLSTSGHPLLIDPGTATYTIDPVRRDRFRSTAMHNTLVLDGRPQSIPAGPFHWASRADARLTYWHASEDFDFAEGAHDAYAASHRRAVLRARHDLWIVLDFVPARGAHRADTYWHLAPAWTVDRRESQTLYLRRGDLRAVLATTAPGWKEYFADPQGLGWCAPVYGHLLPSLTLCFSAESVNAISIATALRAAAAPVDLVIRPHAVTTDVDDGWFRAAVWVRHGDLETMAMVAFAGSEATAGTVRKGTQRFSVGDGEVATDARVIVVTWSDKGGLQSLDLIDGAAVSFSGRGGFDTRVVGAQDLHLGVTALSRLSRRDEPRPVG